MSRIAEWLKKAEDLARGHSKQADEVLDRAEQYVKERTGHKYDDQISKGADAVQRRYGGGGGAAGDEQSPDRPQSQAGSPPESQPQPQSQEERDRRPPPQG
ncbi:antitoxin [Nonomuraea sp. MG754425]|uniref:antitoxin n=1 Tax=Nonomuraea sp. MG754425 TaxID=2570319 RepID=UPI001F369477|nr:antitoxin [Nonomuraea sp. MG754425]MCF6471319.1 antitoxin [Nonomuraea sp. MG754425]